MDLIPGVVKRIPFNVCIIKYVLLLLNGYGEFFKNKAGKKKRNLESDVKNRMLFSPSSNLHPSRKKYSSSTTCFVCLEACLTRRCYRVSCICGIFRRHYFRSASCRVELTKLVNVCENSSASRRASRYSVRNK